MGLSLTSKEVKRALEHPELQGKKPFGRGRYSLVFDNADAVLKLTVDRGAVDLQAYLENAYQSLHTLPKIRRVVGEIGECAGQPLWLLEVERLDKLVAGTPQRKQALRLKKIQHGINGKAIAESYFRAARGRADVSAHVGLRRDRRTVERHVPASRGLRGGEAPSWLRLSPRQLSYPARYRRAGS